MTISDADRQRLRRMFISAQEEDFSALIEWAYEREQASGGGGGGTEITVIPVDDGNATVPAAAGTTLVLVRNLSANRSVELPPADGPIQQVIVKDASGNASESIVLSVVAVGGDIFPVDANSIIHANGVVAFINDGIASWFSPIEVSPELAEALDA